MHRQPYRSDVDGLRAIAVLMVVAFHLGIETLSGGFAGVDVFYVISGFVIFRIIFEEVENGSFSAKKFYERRIKRILPALLLVNISSLLVGYLILMPDEFRRMSESIVASIFSFSNIYFFDRLNYFAAASNSTPLLHTWSLGVEEQFYITAPLLILFLKKANKLHALLKIICGVFALSFLYNLFAVYLISDENHAFYLPMPRFWEICAGGLAARFESRTPSASWARGVMSALGFAGILSSALLIDENTPFPGLAAILPVASTVLLILAQPLSGSLHARVLTSAPFQFFGKVSYSLYLWHWPMIVFTGLYLGRDLAPLETMALFIAMSAAAYLNLRLIENPVRSARRPKPRRQALGAIAISVGAVLGLSFAGIASGGFPARMSDEIVSLASSGKESDHRAATTCRIDARFDESPNVRVCGNSDSLYAPHAVLLGDSHAGMLAMGFLDALSGIGARGFVATLPNCPPIVGAFSSVRKNRQECQDFMTQMVSFVHAESLPVVVLASRWANFGSTVRAPGDGQPSKRLFDSENGGREFELRSALERTVMRFSEAGARVIIIGPVPEVEFDVPTMIARSAYLKRDIPGTSRQSFEERQAIVLSALKEISASGKATILYPHEFFCDDRACAIERQDAPLYVDDDHVSAAGLDLMAPLLSQILQEIAESM